MNSTFARLRTLCPEVDEALIRAHAERLGPEYFDRFSDADITEHLRGLARVSAENPFEILVRAESGQVECTVLSFDYPSVFSLITGLLAASGFSIERGDVFTWRAARSRGASRRGSGRVVRPSPSRRRIVDQFRGRLDPEGTPEAWEAEFRAGLDPVMRLLEAGDPAGFSRARHLVNERVTRRLAALKRSVAVPVLYPVELAVDDTAAEVTRLRITSQDTPAFLYALSTALALQQCSIERVQIRTVAGRIEDTVDLVDAAGRPLTDPARLDALRLSVLLTKQFTYFLDRAPDPYSALVRFERLVEDIIGRPGGEAWFAWLSNPGSMEGLARLLGASDYLWEDFIRLQYESLMPMLQSRLGGRRLATPKGDLRQRLEAALRGAPDGEERRRRINAFKDEECYRIDLDHILQPGDRFREMAAALTVLAEEIVRAAAELVYEELAARYGRPRTVGGLDTVWTVLGLGKLGGAALGYASDIELLFVYADNGSTDGSEPLDNADFFGRLAQETARAIRSKREGIFRVDLRLRPHGNSGPPACSLEAFCRYYGPGGPAHSYERLALVRLRAVAGDAALGARIERLRDGFVYESPDAIRLDDLRSLRSRQFREKVRGGGYNAKFSPGALVDLEYAVQILQILHGGRHAALRTPRIHAALDGLQAAGVLAAGEHGRLVSAYDFLRRLINGLRMLRGSAIDLLLPDRGSDEFVHLARRMGYEPQGDLAPEQQLLIEFDTRTASVRTFVERHFGRESLPGTAPGNVADLILRETGAAADSAQRILEPMGFRRALPAMRNLRALAGGGSRREAFLPLAVLACDLLKDEPDPDMALNNWERFVDGLPDAAGHFRQFLSQPRRLELLLAIFSRSQFLADTLIRNPDVLDWVTTPARLHAARLRDDMEEELRTACAGAADAAAWRRVLRRFRRREVLRIGVRDLCLRRELPDIVADLSSLADAVVRVALERAAQDLARHRDPPVDGAVALDGFCLMAFGKLGGQELNYSSDIDLLGVYADEAPLEEGFYESLLRRLALDLSQATEDGYVFRVDYRLRPYGSSGSLCVRMSRLTEYYRTAAAAWEWQAALKLRAVAGNVRIGAQVLAALRPRLLVAVAPREIAATIEALRGAAARQAGDGPDVDVKSGIGGIRDIEFLTQGLQRMHASQRPELLEGNTLAALRLLADAGILSAETAALLADDYAWFRRIEHYLQILHDRQTHRLPVDPDERNALARRVGGRDADVRSFVAELAQRRTRTRKAYEAFLHSSG